MVSSAEASGWAVVMSVLVALAVPWFLWGDDRAAAGLPLWLWWHVGWMVLASVVFWLFAARAWGIGITGRVGGKAA
jgi:hypothetical protein